MRPHHVDVTVVVIVAAVFLLVTVLGFAAARWRRAESLAHLDEWGLGGRSFGTVVTWFLLGGDLYTAYTFIAVPALMFAAGAAGFFAVPYTVIVYPLVFVFLPRLWSVSHRHGYVTPADFIRGRYGSRSLSIAVALTGLLATMPYIALQLVGIQAVLEVAGIGGSGNAFLNDLPLLVAFAALAAYTYSSGLRAPALIAFVKDLLIYAVVLVAVLYIPGKLGGWGHIFDSAQTALGTHTPKGSIVPGPAGIWPYATLALGSAMALFMYPHSITAVLSTRRRDTARRNAALLPAYSLLLGLIALLGLMALTAKVSTVGFDGKPNAQLAVPQLFADLFPSWFTGVAFAAIAVGALVPAAIMSIAAANLFTRNVYRELLRPQASPAEEAQVAKVVSLLVKVGALVFVLSLDRTLAINFQLLGGIWMLQIFPALVFGLFTRWFHRWALLAGWAAAMVYGTVKAYNVINPTTGKHFGGSAAAIPLLQGRNGYIALTAFVLNLAVAVVGTVVLRMLRVPEGVDATSPDDYFSDVDDAVTDATPHPAQAGSGAPLTSTG
ncbi:MAG: sodium/proline symporter [Frankiales bacterium]|nr:sodium/proline symporter [Frankiales bacterium]